MSIRDELASLLDRHLSDRDNDQGCRLACGYDGDDRCEHLADAILAAGWSKQAPCVMTHTQPFDFGQCETHDETFPLGGVCRFHERDMVEVLFEAADEQSGRAVRAEMYLDHVRAIADELLADIPYDTDNEHARFIGQKIIDSIGGKQ